MTKMRIIIFFSLLFLLVISNPGQQAKAQGNPSSPGSTISGAKRTLHPRPDSETEKLLLKQENGGSLSADEKKRVSDYWQKYLDFLKQQQANGSKSPQHNPEMFKLQLKKSNGEPLTADEQKQLSAWQNAVAQWLSDETSKAIKKVDCSAQQAFEELDKMIEEDKVKDASENPAVDELYELLQDEKKEKHLVPPSPEDPATNELPRPTPPIIVSMDQTITQDLLSLNVAGDGKSTRSVTLSLLNNSPLNCFAHLAAGTCLSPADNEHFQTMMVIKPCTIYIPSSSARKTELKTICADSKALLPPAAQNSTNKTTYTIGNHSNPEFGKFASTCISVVAEKVKNGSFADIQLLKDDPQSALQLTVWKEFGSRTPSTEDDINEKSVGEDVYESLKTSLGRPVTPEEKGQLKPSIVEMLKSIDLCQKTCKRSLPVKAASTLTGSFIFVTSK